MFSALHSSEIAGAAYAVLLHATEGAFNAPCCPSCGERVIDHQAGIDDRREHADTCPGLREDVVATAFTRGGAK